VCSCARVVLEYLQPSINQVSTEKEAADDDGARDEGRDMQDVYEEPYQGDVENGEEPARPKVVEECLVREVPDDWHGVQAIDLAL